jgi:hypothetical protein
MGRKTNPPWINQPIWRRCLWAVPDQNLAPEIQKRRFPMPRPFTSRLTILDFRSTVSSISPTVSISQCPSNREALPDNHFYSQRSPPERVGDETILAAVGGSFAEVWSKSSPGRSITRDVEDSARVGGQSFRGNCNGRWVLVSISPFFLENFCLFVIRCLCEDEIGTTHEKKYDHAVLHRKETNRSRCPAKR